MTGSRPLSNVHSRARADTELEAGCLTPCQARRRRLMGTGTVRRRPSGKRPIRRSNGRSLPGIFRHKPTPTNVHDLTKCSQQGNRQLELPKRRPFHPGLPLSAPAAVPIGSSLAT